MSVGQPQPHGQISRVGGGSWFLGCLQISYGPDDLNDFYSGGVVRRYEVYGDRAPPPGSQMMKINLNAAGRYGYEFYPAIPGGGCETMPMSGICTVSANVGSCLVGLGIQSRRPDWPPGSPPPPADPIITFIEWVDPPPPPAPPDPMTTIGSVDNTPIRVITGDTINPVDVVAVTLSADYALAGGFPRPVATPAAGTLPNGGTFQFFRPEADALVTAGAGTYA